MTVTCVTCVTRRMYVCFGAGKKVQIPDGVPCAFPRKNHTLGSTPAGALGHRLLSLEPACLREWTTVTPPPVCHQRSSSRLQRHPTAGVALQGSERARGVGRWGAGSELMARLAMSLLVMVVVAGPGPHVVAEPPGPAGRGRTLGRLLAAHAPAEASDVNPRAPTDAALASVSRKFRGQKPPMRPRRLPEPTRQAATAGGTRTGCPEPLAGTVNATGLLPVDYFRDTLNVTCDQAVRLAMNMSRDHCGGVLYFVSPCGFASTVEVIGGTGFAGGANGQDEFSTQPQTVISGPASGPAFSVQHVDQATSATSRSLAPTLACTLPTPPSSASRTSPSTPQPRAQAPTTST